MEQIREVVFLGVVKFLFFKNFIKKFSNVNLGLAAAGAECQKGLPFFAAGPFAVIMP